MQIRYTIEIYFAVHILIKNDLSALLLQINPRLIKGKTDQIIFGIMNEFGNYKYFWKTCFALTHTGSIKIIVPPPLFLKFFHKDE